MKSLLTLISLISMVFLLTGCGSMGKKLKAFLGGKPEKAPVARTFQGKGRAPVHFSQRPDLGFNTKRHYKRMTKGRFEGQAKVGGDSGSLWVMDGQGAYLFSQNRVRKVGDLLNVHVKGAAKEQLQTKVKVIKRLLRKLELERKSRLYLAAKKNRERRNKKKEGAADKPGENAQAAANPVANRRPAANDNEEFSVKTVPTRIVEKLPDGNYRVKGHQAFMIGKKEYKTIITGIVRAEDFNEDGVDSGKILDPRYDIVADRRSMTR